MFRTAVFSCALTLLAMAASGCMTRYESCGPEGPSPAGLTSSDLVGSWRGDPRGHLELRAAGAATLTDWPADATPFGDLAPDERPGLSNGTWSLTPGMEQGRLRLDLDFLDDPAAPEGGGTVLTYDVSGTRAHPVLYMYTSDPDRCEFHTLRR
ncbi:hypothetical protein ABZ930_15455 [Streptomyces sp. NPDC046716]|uniref:hypothetical protein n=1 Tax=Streptomyces sp. NPDC046716 TaxID=3157093 RepID=UPI0034084994